MNALEASIKAYAKEQVNTDDDKGKHFFLSGACEFMSLTFSFECCLDLRVWFFMVYLLTEGKSKVGASTGLGKHASKTGYFLFICSNSPENFSVEAFEDFKKTL